MPKITISIETTSAEEAASLLEQLGQIPPSRAEIEGQLAAAKPGRGKKDKAVTPAPIEPPVNFAAPQPVLDPGVSFGAPQVGQGAAGIPNFQDAFAQPFGGAPNPNAPAPQPAGDPSPSVTAAREALEALGQKNDRERVAAWAGNAFRLGNVSAADLFGTGPGTGKIVSVDPQLLDQVADLARKS